MMKRTFWLISIAMLPIASGQLVAADSNWHFSGSNTLRIEHYEADNNGVGTPYPALGGQEYDEFNLSFSGQLDDYERVNGQFYGLASHSEYRSSEYGGALERGALSYENGRIGVPLRIELGDIYSYFSQRTIQRTLKGLQVELQPFRNAKARHSIQLFSGAGQQRYDEFDYDEEHASGASWLVEHRSWGALAINIVNSAKELNNTTLTQEQTLASIAGETFFNLGDHSLTFETEIAHFKGDHNDDFSQTSLIEDVSDNGYFAQLRGNAYQKLSYRLVFDQYYAHFRPEGTSVIHDRRARQAFSGWRFDSGIELKGRYQWFEDRFDSFNPLETRTTGVDLSGLLLPGVSEQLTGLIRLYNTDVEDELLSVDKRSNNLDASLNFPLANGLPVTLRYLYQGGKDAIDNTRSKIRQLSLSTLSGFNLWGIQGSFSPGINFIRTQTSSADTMEAMPTVFLSGRYENHNLNLSLSLQSQNHDNSTSSNDTDTRQAGFHYDYRAQQHEFGVDANYYKRLTKSATDLDANKVSVYWRFHFDTQSATPTSSIAMPSPGDALNISDISLLTQIAPGQASSDVNSRLKATGLQALAMQPAGSIYETKLLTDIDLRQRLVIQSQNQQTTGAGLIINFETFATSAEKQQAFNDVAANLQRSLGRPDAVYESGEFSENLGSDLNAGRFIRIMEWKTKQGLIRFGIPRRLDTVARMEIQHRARFPTPGQGRWGLERVR